MKVGDYVRTRDGIAKIEKIRNGVIILDVELDLTAEGYGNQYLKEDIIKSSQNIIDLIEVGDYVNGHRVIDFMLENGKRKGIIVDADIWGFDIDEIKSIVTKEQFENMKYKVGE